MKYRFTVEEFDACTNEHIRSIDAYVSEKRAEAKADSMTIENKGKRYEVWDRSAE